MTSLFVEKENRYSRLLENFRNLLSISSTDQTKLQNLLVSFREITAESQQKSLLFAPDFNLFTLLGLSRNEVSTHSAVFSEFLNPRSTHGQGTLFLKQFFQVCKEKDPNNSALNSLPENLDEGKWSVLKEHHTKYGRVDLVISNRSLGFLCVIENKIDAREQQDQLRRYSQWTEDLELEYPFHCLVFLTIHGNEASTAGNKPYIPISYKEDIYKMLQRSVTDIHADAVRFFIQQYCDLTQLL